MWLLKRDSDGKYFSGFEYDDLSKTFDELINSKFAKFDTRRPLIFTDVNEVCEVSEELRGMNEHSYIYKISETVC